MLQKLLYKEYVKVGNFEFLINYYSIIPTDRMYNPYGTDILAPPQNLLSHASLFFEAREQLYYPILSEQG
jgi:hypothetical protein